MLDAILAFLGAVLGGMLGAKFFQKWTHKTYISCPKGAPKNLTRIIKEHDELIHLVGRINKYLDKKENKK